MWLSPCRSRNARKSGLLLILLDEVSQGGEDQDAHGQEEQEQAELFVAVLQRVSDGLEINVTNSSLPSMVGQGILSEMEGSVRLTSSLR